MNTMTHTLTADHQSRLQRELDEGEEVRWVAQPLERLLIKKARVGWGIALIAACLFGGMFVLIGALEYFFPSRDPTRDPPVWGPIIFGVVVMLAGVCSLPLFIQNAKTVARETIYAITDKRAIILVAKKNGSITERDYRGDELIHLARNEEPDGTGTLTFESARGAGASSGTTSRHKFQAIENVIEVERMLRDQFGAC
jgi:hypothetical protein